jgi:hypothetical protein
MKQEMAMVLIAFLLNLRKHQRHFGFVWSISLRPDIYQERILKVIKIPLLLEGYNKKNFVSKNYL